MTQKELASRLLVSDKAVSKWETGNSMPDITLLVPLAEVLNVTVTELLECKRMEKTDSLDANRTDEIVKKVITLSEEEQDLFRMNLCQILWEDGRIYIDCYLGSWIICANACYG